jgi:putative proteasome-type protease
VPAAFLSAAASIRFSREVCYIVCHTGIPVTFCIASRVQEGIVALADTRIVKGGERLSKAKLALHLASGGSFFTMTSGLRSIRDKMLIYGEEAMAASQETFNRLYQVANLLGEQLRRVRAEDLDALQKGQLNFNMHAIIGGQLRDDLRPTLFLIYPEGNWIEVNDDSPYFVIGRTPNGRAILDRHLTSNSTLAQAANLSLLAFDMTASSVTDVDYPIDMAIMKLGQTEFKQHRFQEDELKSATQQWHDTMAQALQSFPVSWLDNLMS